MPMPTLEEIRTRGVEVRTACETHIDKIHGLRDIAEADRSNTWLSDLRATTALLQSADTEMQHLENVWQAEARSAQDRTGGTGPQAATGPSGRPAEFRTAGDIFTSSEEIKEWMKRGIGGNSPAVEMERRTLISSGTSAGDGGILLPRGDPYLSPGGLSRRRLFVRDLVSPGTTTLSSVPYVRELTPRTLETAATAQVEGAAKPEAEMTFVAVDAPVRTIAAWVPITNQVFEDAPTLASYIDNRLVYMVLLAEEASMLYGPGTGSTITGIANTSGVQAQVFSTDIVTTIGKSVSKIELVDGEADGVAINPTDFWSMVTLRSANQFDGEANGSEMNAGAPFGPPALTVWGLPAIRSRAITASTAIVGAWRMGAQVFDRTTVMVKYSENYSDYFVKNKTVILAEARLAFAVHRPDFFVIAALA